MKPGRLLALVMFTCLLISACRGESPAPTAAVVAPTTVSSEVTAVSTSAAAATPVSPTALPTAVPTAEPTSIIPVGDGQQLTELPDGLSMKVTEVTLAGHRFEMRVVEDIGFLYYNDQQINSGAVGSNGDGEFFHQYDLRHIALSPDGSKAAFVVSNTKEPYVVNYGDVLMVLDLRTLAKHRVFFNEGDGVAYPTWSPDGTYLAFEHTPDWEVVGEVHAVVAKADGWNTPEQLVRVGGQELGIYRPQWIDTTSLWVTVQFVEKNEKVYMIQEKRTVSLE